MGLVLFFLFFFFQAEFFTKKKKKKKSLINEQVNSLEGFCNAWLIGLAFLLVMQQMNEIGDVAHNESCVENLRTKQISSTGLLEQEMILKLGKFC